MPHLDSLSPGDVEITTALVVRHIACTRCSSHFELPPHMSVRDDGTQDRELRGWLQQHRGHTEALRFRMVSLPSGEDIGSAVA